jgi:allantoin racemase
MMRSAAATPRAGASGRLLVINPNSNPCVTSRVRRVADKVLGAGFRADVVNPEGTPRAIETRAHRLEAEPKVVALIEAAATQGYAGFVLACFDDIAVEATRGRFGLPVVCAVEASLALARAFAAPVGIVTTFDAAVPRIEALVARYGVASVCGVRAAGIGVAAAAELDPEAHRRLGAAIAALVSEDGARAVILGSGGLAGHAATFATVQDVPIIDSIEAAIAFGAAAAAIDRAPMSFSTR